MPFLLFPVVAVSGFVAGSWMSNGWSKCLIILVFIAFIFIFAKKVGVIK